MPTAPRVFTHKWHEGDFVVWDNRCVLHRGRPWAQNQPRVMFRTTIAGDGHSNDWLISESNYYLYCEAGSVSTSVLEHLLVSA